MPYNNEKLWLQKDLVSRKRSRDAMQNLVKMRESFSSKWNQKLIQHVTQDVNFKHNNAGVSFLTAPIN